MPASRFYSSRRTQSENKRKQKMRHIIGPWQIAEKSGKHEIDGDVNFSWCIWVGREYTSLLGGGVLPFCRGYTSLLGGLNLLQGIYFSFGRVLPFFRPYSARLGGFTLLQGIYFSFGRLLHFCR